MEATHYNPESAQMIEVEIYETGEKILIANNKQIANQNNIQDRSIIITAAMYDNYKTRMLNHYM